MKRSYLNTEKFINKSNEIHKFKYLYKNAIYKGYSIKLLIECPKHGEFEQSPVSHLSGSGCSECSKEYVAKFFSDTIEKFTEKANIKHNYKYIYSKVVYKNSKTKIIIFCPEKYHGDFIQMPHAHLNGAGCPKCGGSLLGTTQLFIEKANLKHKNKYIYDMVHYINTHTKINIICPKNNHGLFLQTPGHHLRGRGCPKCGSNNISNAETQWLDYLNIPKENRHITININNTIYVVDAYVPETNTIYEFNGDYWHGNLNKFKAEDINKSNKKTFGKLNEMTIKKEQNILSAGYNLVSIWETDWNKIRNS